MTLREAIKIPARSYFSICRKLMRFGPYQNKQCSGTRRVSRSSVLNRCLRGGKSGYRYAEGRTRHIVQAHPETELNRGRVAAMLAADAELESRTGRAPQLRRHFHQLADADLIELGKGVGLVDIIIIIRPKELIRVVTREAEGHLGQVVGAHLERAVLVRPAHDTAELAADRRRDGHEVFF